jgi:transposase-like protein
VTSSDAGESRRILTEAIQDLQRRRHDARRVLIALGRAEGQTIAELAEAWGISRQLVSRFLAEDAQGAAPTGAETGTESVPAT